jgi:monomeric sarcosine oxidase
MSSLRAVVVGGGVMGLSAGCALAELGAEVTLLERFTIAHDWAASHGLSRVIRYEYGPVALYSRMVGRSLELWEQLAKETGRTLYTQTGVLSLDTEADGETKAGYTIMRSLGLPVELLSQEECAHRFPQFSVGEYRAITYNPVGGMLHVMECMKALTQRFLRLGGKIQEGLPVESALPTSTGGMLRLRDGTSQVVDRVILVPGAWIHEVLPSDLRLPVSIIRGQVCHFGGLSQENFGVGRFPVFMAEGQAYGLPLHGPGWLKVGTGHSELPADPKDPYYPDEATIGSVRAFLLRVVPMAGKSEITFVDRCMYDMTPDRDFIIDVHPGGPGVVIGTGFSGHGFKFGILIGKLLADVALSRTPEFPIERFRIDRFAKVGNLRKETTSAVAGDEDEER